MSDGAPTPAPGRRGAARDAAVALVDLATAATTAYDRPDLGSRLADAGDRLTDPAVHVLVVGEFKQGKSLLVNALLNAPVCPVDDDITTAIPTIVRAGDTHRVTVLRSPAGDPTGEAVREEIDPADAPGWITSPAEGAGVRTVEIELPRELLAGGLVLVDTPGVGGLGSAHSAATVASLPMAHALLFVSDASQEYTAPEIAFLRTAISLCPNVVCVVTKTDFYPSWRTVVDADDAHLRAAGIDAELIAVSSTLRIEAARTNDRALNEESGYPPLVARLRAMASDDERLAVGRVVTDVRFVATQLETGFEAQRLALADPARTEALVEELQAAKKRAEHLRAQSARWQQTLNDGVADLNSDIDHDLRARTREVLRVADGAIEAGDPLDVWDEFEGWLYRRTNEEVMQTYRLLHERAHELAGRVAELFDEEHRAATVAIEIDVGTPTAALSAVRATADADLQGGTSAQSAMTALKGSYGGMLMFGMFAQLIGIAVAGPAIPVLGVLMGRKAVKEEKDRQLALRRSQSKSAVRSYVDDVSFNVTKESRDLLRQVQRQLRDHFAAQAEELLKSATVALITLQQSAGAEQQEREQRQRNVEAELARVRDLLRRADALERTPTGRRQLTAAQPAGQAS